MLMSYAAPLTRWELCDILHGLYVNLGCIVHVCSTSEASELGNACLPFASKMICIFAKGRKKVNDMNVFLSFCLKNYSVQAFCRSALAMFSYIWASVGME